MDLKKFTEDAIRTESVVEQLKFNTKFVTQLVDLMVAAGSILDQVKKNSFYGKPFDIVEVERRKNQIKHSLRAMNEVDDPSQDLQTNEVNSRIFHAIVGMNTECTELLEALDLWGGEMDNVNILEEIGDTSWYQAILIDELEGDWDQILDTVIAKLRARYPDKFTSEDAINRDLTKEREILNGMENNTK